MAKRNANITGWITVNGRHIPLIDGESKTSATKRFINNIKVKSNNFNSMTRKQLAEYVVDNQISRGIVKKENRNKQVQARLKGGAGLKAESKTDLIKAAKAMPTKSSKYIKKKTTKTETKKKEVKQTKKSITKKEKDTLNSPYATLKGTKLEYKGSTKKEKLVNEVAYQTGIKLQNSKSESLNQKRNYLYTKISRKDYNDVVGYLKQKGYKVEEHINDQYWIWLNKK